MIKLVALRSRYALVAQPESSEGDATAFHPADDHALLQEDELDEGTQATELGIFEFSGEGAHGFVECDIWERRDREDLVVLVEHDAVAKGDYGPDQDTAATFLNVSDPQLHASCALVEHMGLHGEDVTLEAHTFLVGFREVVERLSVDLLNRRGLHFVELNEGGCPVWRGGNWLRWGRID